MAISYGDSSYRRSKRREARQGKSGPILALAVVVAGLLWLGPQTTSIFQGVVSSMLRLPIY
jgi:hypothetical protein